MKFVELNQDNFRERTEEWLKFISQGKTNNKYKISDTVLLVIDMQNYFMDNKSTAYFENSHLIINNINKLIAFAENNNIPIFYTIHFNEINENQKANSMVNWWVKYPKKNTVDCKLNDKVRFINNSQIIYKETYSVFKGTEFEKDLKSKGIKNIIVAGIKTNLCCESTVRDAFIKNYNVLLVADATATNNEFMHLASLTNLSYGFAKITTTENIHKSFY
ncbi:MAG: isochorismatase family cysteine hydrolase [Candidatus Kapaibacterium sp.]